MLNSYFKLCLFLTFFTTVIVRGAQTTTIIPFERWLLFKYTRKKGGPRPRHPPPPPLNLPLTQYLTHPAFSFALSAILYPTLPSILPLLAKSLLVLLNLQNLWLDKGLLCLSYFVCLFLCKFCCSCYTYDFC